MGALSKKKMRVLLRDDVAVLNNKHEDIAI